MTQSNPIDYEKEIFALSHILKNKFRDVEFVVEDGVEYLMALAERIREEAREIANEKVRDALVKPLQPMPASILEEPLVKIILNGNGEAIEKFAIVIDGTTKKSIAAALGISLDNEPLRSHKTKGEGE